MGSGRGQIERLRGFIASYDPRFWILFGGFIVSSMGFAMIVPFVSLYFHKELGVPMSVVGTFFLTTAIVRATSQGFAGDLSDRIGRIHLMTWGQAARALVFGVMAVAVFRGAGFWISAGILVLSYIAGAFYQPVASAAVADLSPPERRLEAYSIMRVSHNLGWGIGPMIGGFVAGLGYGWLFVVGALTSLFSAWLVARFVPETHPPSARRPPTSANGNNRGIPAWMEIFEVRRDRRFLLYCVLAGFIFIAMSQWLSTLSVYASDQLGVTTKQLGFMFGVNGFMVVAFQVAVTRLTRRFTLIGSMVLGALIYAIAYTGIGFATAYGHLVIGMIVITIGELIVSPPSVALVSLISPEGRTGRYMGVYSLTSSFGWSGGPFVGGVLIDLFSDRPPILWGSVAAFALVAAIGLWTIRSRFPARSA